MFTGIIENTASIERLSGEELTLASPWEPASIRLGQSIAIDGCCLTVTRVEGTSLTFQISSETFQKTAFGRKTAGDAVNLERAMALGERLDGHIVTGHVDAVAKIVGVESRGTTKIAWIEVAPEHRKWIISKGSVAIDGVSLTVNDVDGARFSVTWIAHTLSQTTLDRRVAGDCVNIEFDVLGKYVDRILEVGRGHA